MPHTATEHHAATRRGSPSCSKEEQQTALFSHAISQGKHAPPKRPRCKNAPARRRRQGRGTDVKSDQPRPTHPASHKRPSRPPSGHARAVSAPCAPLTCARCGNEARASPSDTLRGGLHPCSSRPCTRPPKPVLPAHARQAAGAAPRARPAAPSARRSLNAVDDTTNGALLLLYPGG